MFGMFVHLTVGFWLGIYAVRTFVPAAVWNVSDALPLYLKGGIAVGVHLIGIIGGIILSRRSTSTRKIVVALAFITVVRQFWLGLDMPGAIMSMLGWIVWLWWVAAVPARAGRMSAAAFATAFTLQILTQWLWHGLDLPMAIGPASWLVACVLGAAFCVSYREQNEAPTWLPAVAGPAFFLEITLLANAGRIAIVGSEGAIAFAIAQAAIIALLAIASNKTTSRPATLFAFGWIASFALLFAFYNQYEWPTLWIVAAALVVVGAMPGVMNLRFDRRTGIAAVLLAATVLLPRSPTELRNYDVAKLRDYESRRLVFATYNIHQGFDAYGAPGMTRIVDEIASLNADVVALQEVNRGWTFLGGADLVEYLRYRFPEYTLEFVPVNGSMWGVALMSRVPLLNPQGAPFTAPKNAFGYGYAAADIALGGDTIHVIGLHLTAGLEGNGDHSRADQANELVKLAENQDNTIVMGDFNSERYHESIKAMMAAGYRDVLGEQGLAEQGTWPANEPKEHIDYVFTRGRIKMTNGRIPDTLASDHLPVVFDVELDR